MILSRFILIPLIVLFSTSPAHAYIDPGLGSMLLQGLLAAIVGVAAFWHRSREAIAGFIKKVVSKGKHRSEGTNDKPS